MDAEQLAEMTGIFEQLEARVLDQFADEGAGPDQVTFARTLGVRYRHQVHTIDVEVAPGAITVEAMERVEHRFVERYTQSYGAGALLHGGTLEFEQHRVVGTRQLDRIPFPEHRAAGRDSSSALKGQRRAYFEPDGFLETPVYDGRALRPGNTVLGPAVIERMGDSAVIPHGMEGSVDAYLTMRVRPVAAPAPASLVDATPELEIVR